MDLIDFKEQAGHDFPEEEEIRRIYKYVLVVRDHFTRLVVLRPLQSKSSKLVALELSWICNLIGYPLILQTDNGGEVKGEEVIKELNIISPYSHAVQGRPRTPRDQGSVERANRMIKELIQKAVAVKIESGISNANWVNTLPQVMAGCNSVRNKGASEVSPYRAVFGMDYDHPIVSSNLLSFKVGEDIQERIDRIGGDYKRKIDFIENYEMDDDTKW